MKISCPSCEAKYSIGDDKVQSRLAKIRCRKCGVDIVIDGRVQPPTVSVGDATVVAHAATADTTAAAPTAAGGQSYTVDFGESDQRPMSLDELVSAYNAGYVTPETFIWAEGMADWTPLGQVPEVVDALNAVASAPAAAEPERQSAAPVSHVPAASTAKAARAQGRGGTDLFGAIATAGSEEDMARQAAHEPFAPQATTGARNESSVLFSLSALTASAKPSSASATSQSSLSSTSSATTSKEDSGLIDLKALTSQATNASAAPNTVGLVAPAPLGGFGGGIGAPLGGIGAPLGGGMAQGLPAVSPLGDITYPQKKSRTGLYILGAAGIVAIAIVAGLALQPAELPPAPKAEPAPLVTYKAPEPEPIKPATEAKPPPTGEAAASASAAPAKAPTAKWKASTTKKTSGATTTSGTKSSGSSGSGDSAPTPKKPPAGKCGCAAGDLGCAMRCAAKGG